jgi:hypothetical protein
VLPAFGAGDQGVYVCAGVGSAGQVLSSAQTALRMTGRYCADDRVRTHWHWHRQCWLWLTLAVLALADAMSRCICPAVRLASPLAAPFPGAVLLFRSNDNGQHHTSLDR